MEATASLPALRDTITEIERWRGEALLAFEEAFDKLKHAEKLADRASNNRHARLGIGREGGYREGVTTCKDAFLTAQTKELDRGIWTRLLDHMGLEKLMDHTAREEFRTLLRENPPPATADNCFATLSGLVEDSGLIFRRGLATAFSKLDRRFRSHDGFKIGSRLIFDHMYSEFGTTNYHQEERLRDVERVFFVLDGKPHADRSTEGSITHAMYEAKRKLPSRYPKKGVTAHEVENDYFRLKVYQNGNAHCWFKRDDLVLKVNQLLAQYYGATVGEGADAAESRAYDAHAERPSTAMAKNFGFFPTPDELAEGIVERARIEPGMRVLEPSAGNGSLALAARKKGAEVFCVEIQPHLARELSDKGFTRVKQMNFLELAPHPSLLFDRVVMNPPFDRGLDVDHVNHALKFVKPGGRLVAIMSASTEFREDRKTVLFRERVEKMKDRWEPAFSDLPAGSFASVGTYVNTIVLSIRLPE
jgi:predicted RNA methylase